MAHAEHPLPRLPHHGKGFRQQVVEGLARGQAGAEFDGLAAQTGIVKGRHRLFEAIDPGDDGLQTFEFTIVFAADNFSDQTSDHRYHSVIRGASQPPRVTVLGAGNLRQRLEV
ncbi:hypothetical protein JCM30471_13850 [Desulfuromonas carbonis]